MCINHVLRILYIRDLTAYDVQSSSPTAHCTPPPYGYGIRTHLHFSPFIYIRDSSTMLVADGAVMTLSLLFFFHYSPRKVYERKHFSAFQIVTNISKHETAATAVIEKKIWKNLIIFTFLRNS